MATENVDGKVSFLAPVVLAFPDALFEAKRAKRGGKEVGDPKFGCTLVLDPENPETVKLKEVTLALITAHGYNTPEKLKEVRRPWRKGETAIEKRKADLVKKGKEYAGDADYAKGKLLLSTKSKNQPNLSVFIDGKVVDLDTPEAIKLHKSKFFFGAEVLAQVTLAWYDPVEEGDKAGVTCYVNLVCATGKGKRLSGGARGSEVFKGYAGKPTGENPTVDLDEDETY